MVMTRRACALFVILLLALILLPVSGAFAAAPPPESRAGTGRVPIDGARPDYALNQVIVKFKDGTGDVRRGNIKRSAGAEATLRNIGPDGSDCTQLVQLKGNVSVESAITRLQANPEVSYAEPNYIAHKTYTPADPAFPNQWGLNNTGQTIAGQPGTPGADIDAVNGWNVETGGTTPITVAVIDTGGDLNHPDLSSKFVAGYNYAGITQYVDGYYDAYGWNYYAAFFGTVSFPRVSQTITGTGQNLTSIALEYFPWGTPTGTITVSVRSAQDGPVLASYTVSPSEVTGLVYIDKPLSSPVMLTNGVTYYIDVRSSVNDNTNHYGILMNPANENPASDPDYPVVDEYLEGSLYQYNGTAWNSDFPSDAFFKTNGNSVAHDDDGHGTHCAGIAAAVQGNAQGGVGVSFGANVMPVKVLDSSGSGTFNDINAGIDFAANNGAQVISMSLGGTMFSQAQQDAINHAHDAHGVIVFASSGNSGDSTLQYPACCNNVAAVGATDNRDHYTSFSTYNAFVDLSAPGWKVYSTLPTYPCEINSWGYSQNYDYLNGTSMACPMAAGLGALVRSKYPSLTPDQVQSRMQTYADDLGGAGRDDHYGWGRINAFNTLSELHPTVSSIATAAGTQGTTVSVTNLAGTDFQTTGTTIVKLKKSGSADITATDVAVASSTRITCKLPIPSNAATGAWNVYVQNAGGQTATKANAFTVIASPVANCAWYLAEGTTDWGFGCYISIQNPNATTVHAAMTYMTSSGPVSGGTVTLPARSQATVNPMDTLGQEDFSTWVVCTEGETIAVDRTMTWTGPGAASSEAHSSVGVTSPAATWYLPEGSSAWGFETWLLIQNPNDSAANCTVTYMIEGASPVTVPKTIAPNTRQSFNIKDDIGEKDASIKVSSNIPVIPERAMYRNNRREGHDSIGTTTPASDCFLAEGTTAWGFTTYVLIQNPNAAPSDVTVTYMTSSGARAQDPFTLAGNSRKTIRVNDVPGMTNTDFSTRVHGSASIIAERSMYWNNGTGEACHDSIGMDKAHTTFYLPDGQSSGGCETWTLVQNPNATAVTVEISYLTPTGAGNVVRTETIPASSRQTFGMLQHSGINGRASIMVTSKTPGKKIMVERAMYWNNKGAGTDTIGGYSD
jgi:subtilisin family serine protease